MKTRMLSLVALIGLSSTVLFGNAPATEKFKVAGKCGMCESRIEKAAKTVDGVSAADWDKQTKMIEVTYDSSKTDIHKVHEVIAKAGHDTEMHKASDEVYDKLPGCCKYERLGKQTASAQTANCCSGSKGCGDHSAHTSGGHQH